MEMDFKIIPVEIKAEGDGSTGRGIGNAFHTLDSVNEIVAPGAFIETIPQFLSVGFIGGLNHNWNEPIGKPTDAEEVKIGLQVDWLLSNTAHGKDVKTLLVDGVVKKLSIGYRVLGSEYLETEDAVKDYWKSQGYKPDAEDKARAVHGARLLTKLHLYEVSPVTVPANRHSDITRVKQYNIREFTSLSDYDKLLREAGLSRTETADFMNGIKTLLREAGSAIEPEQPETTDEAFSKSRFEAQMLALKTRHLGRAGASYVQIPGTHSDLSG
jgi:uncharacterized protein